jgi:hypothetical protein
MDKHQLSALLTESLERAALRDREIFVQETIDRIKAKKRKETQKMTGNELFVTNNELLTTNDE